MRVVDGNHSVIFYGAGAQAERRLPHWIAEGLAPVCFADADKSKHYISLGGVEILPLEEAIHKYKDYILYLTVAQEHTRAVREYLVAKGIPSNRITTAEPLEWRIGCSKMGKLMVFNDHSISSCCTNRYAKSIKSAGNVKADYDLYVQYRQEMLLHWRNGEPTHCNGCALLKHDYWEINPALATVIINTARGDYCNFRCSYCYCQQRSGYFSNINKDEHLKRHTAVYQIIRFFHDAFPDVFIRYSAGELVLSPHCNEIIDLWRESKLRGLVSSNASVYNENLACLLRDCDVYLNSSLDAGTPETFSKIKGVDCFDKVADNLTQYSGKGGRIILKYVMLPGINDNKKDIAGFLSIAKRLDAQVNLSNNFLETKQSVPPETLEMFCYFLSEAHTCGVVTAIIAPEHFNSDDMSVLSKYIKELCNGSRL